MPAWLVMMRDRNDKASEQWSLGVKAQTRARAEQWATAWGHQHRPASVVSSRVMTPDEERQYGGVIDADAPGEL